MIHKSTIAQGNYLLNIFEGGKNKKKPLFRPEAQYSLIHSFVSLLHFDSER